MIIWYDRLHGAFNMRSALLLQAAFFAHVSNVNYLWLDFPGNSILLMVHGIFFLLFSAAVILLVSRAHTKAICENLELKLSEIEW